MDRSALSKLESGERPNPTVETLVRYADAVGMRLEVSLRRHNVSLPESPWAKKRRREAFGGMRLRNTTYSSRPRMTHNILWSESA
jgi:transcriptional regulator with XRE-family HTH domain